MSLDEVVAFAKSAHEGQLGKDSLPHWDHVQRVMDNCRLITDEEFVLKVAALHDTVEDTSVTIEQIKALCGEEIANCVHVLTRQSDDSYERFVDEALSHWHYAVRVVKTADLLDNLTRPDGAAYPHLRMRYKRAFLEQALHHE